MKPLPIRICQHCNLSVSVTPLDKRQSAYCPRCNTLLYQTGSASLSGNLPIAITCIALLIPCLLYNYLHIILFGVEINASFYQGVLALISENYLPLAGLVLFCGFIAPLLVCLCVISTHYALHKKWFVLFDKSLKLIHLLKHWVMVDVFLVSIAISCFKLKEYADIVTSPPLYGLLLLQILTIILVSRVSVRRYWESWHGESLYNFRTKEIHCSHCHLSQPANKQCARCLHPLSDDQHTSQRTSVQKTWAYLLSALICFIPANWFAISILFSNGERTEDTIFSGVVALINSGMVGIAIIIFVASILVPAIKIIGLSYLLISVHFKHIRFRRQRMIIYFILKWIGKWSMIDLFVISIMLTLIDRGQVLDFAPGPGAIAFGLVVVFTMLATDSFNPKSLWANQEKALTTESPKNV
ncbi:PqiA/YebS family transporter subunit [Vibrio sp. WJH972]